jgi:hypothetical protein
MIPPDVLHQMIADAPVIGVLLVVNGLIWRRLVRLEEVLITHLQQTYDDPKNQ